jgi:hypothetical protein
LPADHFTLPHGAIPPNGIHEGDHP